jgi:hypothetical protein
MLPLFPTPQMLPHEPQEELAVSETGTPLQQISASPSAVPHWSQ